MIQALGEATVAVVQHSECKKLVDKKEPRRLSHSGQTQTSQPTLGNDDRRSECAREEHGQTKTGVSKPANYSGIVESLAASDYCLQQI